jgi:hypothetical protein
MGFGLNPYPIANTGGASGATGTYTVAAVAPTTAGVGCTLTITTNLSTTATSPPTTIFAYPSGGTITSNIHNAPGWLHSHAYAPQTATITFTNGSANIAWTNVLVAGTPVYLGTTGSLPTNFSVGARYYVIATGLSGSNVQVSATVGGSAIVAGSAGSGTQTGYTSSGPTRVNNGAGWTESTGTWNPGSALNAYQLTSGACTSAASGGPTGTGSAISDGTCTWNYVSATDYVTITGWVRDAVAWASGTTYSYGNEISTNISGHFRSYALESFDGTSGYPLAFCTSTVAPSGLGSGGNSYSSGYLTTADGCTWAYMGDITYSSSATGANSMPFISYATNVWTGDPIPQNATNVSHMSRPYTALLWNDREYVAGANGESAPIFTSDHQGGDHCCSGEATNHLCVGTSSVMEGCPLITIKPADGEGFASGFTSSIPLTGYDPTKGVAIADYGATGNSGYGRWPWGFASGDWNVNINGLQVKSTTADAVLIFNYEYITNNILDGGYDGVGDSCAVWGDVPVIAANNLILSHASGLCFKYGSSVALFNTIVNVGSLSNAICITYHWAWVWTNLIAANNACYNWPHFGSFNTGEAHDNPGYLGAFDGSSKNNITDTPSPDGNQRTVTFTNGSANIAWPSNTLTAGKQVLLQTTGTLPTNFSQGTYYTVSATGLSSSNVQLNSGGSSIVAGSAGSGVHTGMVADNVPVGGNANGGSIIMVPNSTYGASGATMFVSPGSDWRPGPALIGAGASYGSFSWGCGGGGCTPVTKNYDTPDFLGSTRPQSSSWDVGPEQSLSGPYTFVGNSVSPSTFVEGASASTVIGAVVVSTTGTPAGTTTLSLTGANAQGFRLSSTSLPANLICPVAGCPATAGPFTDVNLVATNASATGSPFSSALSLTGVPGGTTVLNSVNLSGNTFTYSCSASTVIGAVTVTTTPSSSFTGTLSLTGANSGGFALSGSNLIANASTGCPSSGGPYSDLNIVATQAGATGSPLTQPETLTGSGGPPSFLRVGGSLLRIH